MPPVAIPDESTKKQLRVAIIGQSTFAAEVFKLLQKDGHEVVGVFTVLDKGNREDPLATIAVEHGKPVYKYKTWRVKGQVIPEILEQYKSVKADINVLPFCTQFIPMEVITFPRHQSICYHPSLLPRHRGASSINWTLIEGDTTCGLSIFWADDGLDTGPLLLQKSFPVRADDTVDTLYNNFLYPEGIKALAESVNMVARGNCPKVPQTEEGATYDPALFKPETHLIDWSKGGIALHNFIRGLDSSPGATTFIKPQTKDTTNIENGTDTANLENGKDSAANIEIKFFGSSVWQGEYNATGDKILIEGLKNPAVIHQAGLLITANDGVQLNIKRLKVNGKMINAQNFFKSTEAKQSLDLTPEERNFVEKARDIWKAILRVDINDETDFFSTGAGSMDVVRLVEEIKDIAEIELENQDVYMNTTFEEFTTAAILKCRGVTTKKEIIYEGVDLEVNKMKIRVPTQLFINGEFVNSEGGKTLDVVNPSNETVVCKVQSASEKDVDKAVMAAERAFKEGEWSKISARERGQLLFKLADLMEQHKEQLATLEAVDSGAVYTLALKTHVGMSIDTWRYFAGCCDKIQGATIPISSSRPHRSLCLTRREPLGVCGLITPWNYPLMMLSWKMAACLAAGNTVVLKPAAVCPLTALKFAELCARAGVPAGVVNIVPGSGAVAGQALASHERVQKLGFTGSTEIGKFAELCARAGVPAGVVNIVPGSGAVAGQALASHERVQKLGFTGSTEIGKFAELCARAGVPAGVVNIVPGSGAVAGQALASHERVQKLGFTGSTEIGKFAELCARAGVPAGVVNIVPGSGAVAGQALASHERVQKLGFTGSTEIGKFAELCARAGVPAAVVNIVPGSGAVAGQALASHERVQKLGFTGSTEIGKFAELCARAGVPAGVVNIVPGSGAVAGQALASHERVQKLGFTGSTEIGKFAELCARAGVPAGVVNIVPGSGAVAGQALASHERVQKLGFTGSTEIGKFAELCARAGVPAGVVNIVPGSGAVAGQALASHERVQKLGFTGSTEIGKFAELCARAGVPAGVVNIVPGSGAVAGQALASHERVQKLGFTGSTEIGKFAELCARAGVPAGVVNIVPGSGAVAGQALASHERVQKLGFTGSTEIGKFAELCARAGVPAGVVNIVPGSGAVAGQALASHERVQKLGFTGSTEIGKFAELCARAGVPAGVVNIVPGSGAVAGQALASHERVQKLGFTGSTEIGKFAELCARAGVPAGVVNIVPGSGAVAGQALASHERVQKLGFTGSTEIGQTIMKSCAESNLKKVSLELGGKSPLIIFEDCDLDKAVRNGMASVFFNKGENCIAAGRLFVEETIHDEFVRRVVEETKKLVIGDPLNRSTSHGPQNHEAHLKKLLEFISTGVSEGARLVHGGTRPPRAGYYLTPAVFTDVTDDMYIAREESFGPIMIISKFSSKNTESVIARANATRYGLAGGVFTRDISRALRVADRVDAGTVFVNTYNKTDVAAPFGGFKQSGFGKDLGQEALNEYLKTKCITIEY